MTCEWPVRGSRRASADFGGHRPSLFIAQSRPGAPLGPVGEELSSRCPRSVSWVFACGQRLGPELRCCAVPTDPVPGPRSPVPGGILGEPSPGCEAADCRGSMTDCFAEIAAVRNEWAGQTGNADPLSGTVEAACECHTPPVTASPPQLSERERIVLRHPVQGRCVATIAS